MAASTSPYHEQDVHNFYYTVPSLPLEKNLFWTLGSRYTFANPPTSIIYYHDEYNYYPFYINNTFYITWGCYSSTDHRPSHIIHFTQPLTGFIYMLLTKVWLNRSIYFSIIHTTPCSWMNSWLLFTPPCLTLALVSNIYSSHQIPYFSIIYQYHNSAHTNPIFFPYVIFEFRHNIQNQPVSKAIPFPNSFRDITSIKTHQLLSGILKNNFFRFFRTV